MSRHLATTNWTLILNAEAATPEVRQAALAELCQAVLAPPLRIRPPARGEPR